MTTDPQELIPKSGSTSVFHTFFGFKRLGMLKKAIFSKCFQSKPVAGDGNTSNLLLYS